MRNNRISHAHEHAKIYQQHYRSSLNVVRLLKSVMAIFLSGSSPASQRLSMRK